MATALGKGEGGGGRVRCVRGDSDQEEIFPLFSTNVEIQDQNYLAY